MKPLARIPAYFAVVLASVLGPVSLLLLVAFLFLGSFDFFHFGLSPAAAVGWNLLLSAAFFLQHSGMIRRSFQRSVERFVPEAFYGIVFTIASASTLILCLVFWQRVSDPLFRLDGAQAWLVHAIFLLAIAGIVWGVRALGSFDAFGVRPVLALLRGTQTREFPVVVKGPYRWVRHPLYFFALVLFWACPDITLDRLLFNVLWTIWVILATVLEERDLVAKFGDAYVQYQREVPMIFPWRSPSPESHSSGPR